MRSPLLLPLFVATIAASTSPAAAQDAAKGKQLFQTCAACHSGQPGSLGPNLKGVVGRRAGSVPGFRYSAAMAKSGLTWTPTTLKAFLQHPQATVPGNRMPFGGFSNPADADAVIKYLTMR